MRVISQLQVVICSFLLLCSTASYSANSKYSSLVIDADTGKVLHQEYAGEYRYPASLTKMMTLYMAFRAIEQNRLNIKSKLKVSAHAAAQPPSKLGLRAGEYIGMQDAIMSLVINSANDMAVVVGEAVGGTESNFAGMMNAMAKRLGMSNTHFMNASGLHHPSQRTTAYDMAKLALALRRDYPKYYDLFNRTRFVYKGRTYMSHNRVTTRYQGADGLKTGYVRASGFNLVTSAQRGANRLVGVVMGGRSQGTRDQHMIRLLDQNFYKMAKLKGNSGEVQVANPTPRFKPSFEDETYARYQPAALTVPEAMGDAEEEDSIPVPVISRRNVRQHVSQ